jgi:hypothetical protein
MADVNGTTATSAGPLMNGARLIGDFLMPGVGLVVDGDVKRGVAHAAVAIGTRTLLSGFFGPIVWVAAGLNSYSTSVTGKNLIDQFDWRKQS